MSAHDTTPAAPSVAPGNIQFIDNFLPLLDPGQYTITAQQTISAPGAQPFGSTVKLTVGGSGLVLGAPDVAAIYPPPNSSAAYGNILPHIVLNVRTLPWEAALHLTPADNTVPWLALVLVADDEGVAMQSVPVAQIGSAPQGTLPPAPPAAEVSSTTSAVTVIDVPQQLFGQIMPGIADLPYLAHCRELSVSDKSTSTLNGAVPGWYSVLVSNRFAAAKAGRALTNYTAHVVSVAGLETYLNGAALPTGTNFVRLVSLAHWSFATIAQGLDFRELMVNMVTPPAGAPAGDTSFMLLRLPPPPASAITDAVHQAAASVLQAGYAAVPYVTREGDHVTAWYRGPFTPAPTTTLPLQPITMSAQAIIYDQNSGMFDISYGAAWETGRLLALSDRSFAASLLNWRTQGLQLLNQLYYNVQQNPTLAGLMDAPENNANVQELRSLLEPNVLQALIPTADGSQTAPLLTVVLQALATDEQMDLPPTVTVPTPSVAAPPSPPVAAPISAALTALTAQPWVASAVAQLTQGGMDIITEWLARLTLFNGVPFNNLVADARMLPPESIRFFYVDATWTNVMIDGALSVGVQSSRDTQFNDMMRQTLQDAVQADVAALRAEMLGEAPSATPPATALCGFLMRSAVVSGWPSLEVRAYKPGSSTGTDADLMKALRMDHVANDVLLVLLPEMPSRIDISEPHESMRFGVEDGGDIDLRSISAANPGAQLGKSTTVAYRSSTGPATILDVAGTLSAIATAAPQLAGIGSAGFAVQMVASPEQMVFWGAGS